MANNLNQSQFVEDEIDLKEIIKVIFKSKKLIILTTLIFILASIIYSLSLKSSFETSAKFEIGHFVLPDGSFELIEQPSSLVSHFKIQMIKNPSVFNPNILIETLEGKIINLKTTSSSGEQNENLLTEIINYAYERHSNLADLINIQKTDKLSSELDSIESQISHITQKNQAQISNIENEIVFLKKNKQIELEGRILQLKSDLPVLDSEIMQLNQAVVDDSNNLNSLKGTSLGLERAASSPTLEQIISSYKSRITVISREKNRYISEINTLTQQLDSIEKDSWHYDEMFLLGQDDEMFLLDEKKRVLENSSQISQNLFTLNMAKKTLEEELLRLTNQNVIQTSPVGVIETKNVKPKTQFIISLGIILGFITSILLVFIINFVKSYKESEA